MEDLLALDGCRPRFPVRGPTPMAAIRTPLKWEEWDRALGQHPDQRFRKYIVDGIRWGFRVGFDYSRTCRKAKRNMASASQQPQVIADYLSKECAAGTVIGPLDPALFPCLHISRFGVIPKGDSGKWRLIVDLSSPEGESVNDGISEERCSLSYISIEDAGEEVKRKGRGALLAKVDIRSAYRVVPIHPEDRWLLGMLWDGGLFLDLALPFGLRSAPKIFTAIADAAEWIIRQRGVQIVLHYLDDFLLIGSPASGECRNGMEVLLASFHQLGLPVATEKTEGPAPRLTFLGFEIDSMAMEIRLPHAKLVALKGAVEAWRGRGSCKKKDLESLAGKLVWACKVVSPGKTFVRRMFELLAVVKKSHHHVRLNAAFRSDLLWWDTFLQDWNGVSLLRQDAGGADHIIWTDASGSFGCGALWPPHWIQFQWPQAYDVGCLALKEESITLKELLPVVLACAVWGPAWRDSTVLVYCDNAGAVAVINSGYSKVPRIMHLVRCMFFIRAFFRVAVRAVHIPGVDNSLADAISRDNLAYLFAQVPAAVQARMPIPPPVLDLLVNHQPDWTSQTWAQLFRNCFRPV